MASVTLPTGGTINYTYTGGSSGHITCADGSASGLTRQTPDGTWTYTRAAGTGAASTTTITDPQSNVTTINFQGIYETQRVVKQGATVLKTLTTCYNGTPLPCSSASTTTAITLPITIRSVLDQYGSSGSVCKHDYFYNTYGLPTMQDDYDYPSATSMLRRQVFTYASLGNGIVSMPQTITICSPTGSASACNGTGTVVGQTTFSYDQTAASATSGTPQHVAVSGSRGNPTTIASLAQGSTTLNQTFAYFDTGNVQTATDVNGAQTSYTYGACGNSFPTSVSEPLSMSRSFAWNCTGGVQLTITDENSKTTTTAYTDGYFWRPASVTDPLSNTTSIGYSTTNPQWVQQSLTFNGNQSIADTGVGFDGLGRLVVQNQQQTPGVASWNQVTQSYDSAGRPYQTSMPCTTTLAWTCPTVATTTTYDGLSRPHVVADGGGGTISYTYNQNDVLITSGPAPAGENAKSRQLEYDALGRLTSVCEITGLSGAAACGQTTSQTGFLTKYTYDAVGNLTGVTQNAQAGVGNQQTRIYYYDLLGRMTGETNPENGGTVYTYESDPGCGISMGDVVKRTHAVGNQVCFAYDALHRLTSVLNYGPYASVTADKFYVYDTATVNGTTMANAKTHLAESYTSFSPTGTPKVTDLGLSYTPRGEVSDLWESTPHSGGYYHTAATYWAHGALDVLSAVNSSGSSTYNMTWNPDSAGRVNSTTDGSGGHPLSGTSYNAASQPTQLNFGSGDSDSFTYDPNTGRMTQYKFTVGTSPQSVIGNLTWNPIGTLSQLAITDPFNAANAQTCNYGHDDLVRIANAGCGTAASQTFSYDAFGNLNKTGSPYAFSAMYSYSTNRMTSIGTLTPSYDADGNVLNDGLHTYSWDTYGEAITVDGVGLTYDALGRMVEQNRSGTYTQFLYSPTGFKMQLLSGQTPQKDWVPLPGGAAAVYSSSVYLRHPDWLGNSRFTSDLNARTMYSDSAYAPFGEPYAQAGATDLSFTGKDQDTVANLYDFPARKYGIQGRWPSPDPAGLASVDLSNPQSWNRYAYVQNSPLNLFDPFGLFTSVPPGCDVSYPVAGGAGDINCPSQPWLTDPNFNCEFINVCSNSGGGSQSAGGGGGGNPCAGSTADTCVSVTASPLPNAKPPSPTAAFLITFFTNVPSTGPGSCLGIFTDTVREPFQQLRTATQNTTKYLVPVAPLLPGVAAQLGSMNLNSLYAFSLNPDGETVTRTLSTIGVATTSGLAAVSAAGQSAAEAANPLVLVGADALLMAGVAREGRAAFSGQCKP